MVVLTSLGSRGRGGRHGLTLADLHASQERMAAPALIVARRKVDPAVCPPTFFPEQRASRDERGDDFLTAVWAARDTPVMDRAPEQRHRTGIRGVPAAAGAAAAAGAGGPPVPPGPPPVTPKLLVFTLDGKATLPQ